MKRILPALLFLLSAAGCYAQTEIWHHLEELDNLPDSYIEEYLEDSPFPLDLNRVNLQSLLKLPFLAPELARRIIAERNRSGVFRSWNDFLKRLNLKPRDWSAWQALFAFGTRSADSAAEPWHVRIRTEIDTYPVQGFQKGRYRGSAGRRLNQIRGRPFPWIETRLTLENDAGEKNIDHWAGYAEMNLTSSLILTLGDFRVEAGQGIALWSGSAFGAARSPSSMVREARFIRGYSGTAEYGNHRGIGLQGSSRNWRYFVFASHTPRDAVISKEGLITSLLETGYHRTKTEYGHADAARETLWGLGILSTMGSFRLGINAVHGHFTHDLAPSSRFNAGRYQDILGLSAQWKAERVRLACEAALVQGVWGIGLSGYGRLDNIDLGITARWLAPDFHPWHGENTPGNEHSLRLALNWRGAPWNILFLYGWLHRPAPTATRPLPSHRTEWELNLRAGFGKQRFLGRIQYKLDERLRKGETELPLTVPVLTESRSVHIRIQWEWQPGPGQRIRAQGNWVRPSEPGLSGNITLPSLLEQGRMAFIEWKGDLYHDLSVNTRLTGYHTDTYTSRLYAVEGGVTGKLDPSVFYGRGVRWMLVVHHQWNRYLGWSCKFIENRRWQPPYQGSGDQKLNRPIGRCLVLQADIVFYHKSPKK
ncbi:MAG TPA: hypothetical protein ENN03_07575 [bacterium]|nr:hypothetical protein [bacterium]